jgi:hypothetical protein
VGKHLLLKQGDQGGTMRGGARGQSIFQVWWTVDVKCPGGGCTPNVRYGLIYVLLIVRMVIGGSTPIVGMDKPKVFWLSEWGTLGGAACQTRAGRNVLLWLSKNSQLEEWKFCLNVRRCKIDNLTSDCVAVVGRLEGARSREGRKDRRENDVDGGTQLLLTVDFWKLCACCNESGWIRFGPELKKIDLAEGERWHSHLVRRVQEILISHLLQRMEDNVVLLSEMMWAGLSNFC